MPSVVRRGDFNSAGGSALGPSAPSVRVNGRPVCVPGDRVTPHPCCGLPGCAKHCVARTTIGSTKVKAEGKGVVFVGSPDSCGHPRANGSFNVNVGI